MGEKLYKELMSAIEKVRESRCQHPRMHPVAKGWHCPDCKVTVRD